MRKSILSIVGLFGECDGGTYKENLKRLDFSYSITLSKVPSKEQLQALLPDIPERDDWRLRMLSEADEALFDLKRGVIVGDKYNVNELSSYIGEGVRILYSVEKNNRDNVLSVYDYELFVNYLKTLHVSEFIGAIKSELKDSLFFEVETGPCNYFSTQSIALIKKGDAIPSLKRVEHVNGRYDQCGRYCQWTSKLPALLPEDLYEAGNRTGGELSTIFSQICLLLSACYVADFSSVDKTQLKIRISGFKTLVSEFDKVKVCDLAFDEKSVEQWFAIYDWCYTGGYTSDRLTIARNIISLNCPNFEKLELNKSTLGAVKSNFRIFEQDNVRQYIKVRKDVSSDLLTLQDKINSIVEGFTGDFRKSVVGLGTFFLTLVVVRVVAGGHWYEPFCNQIVMLSFLFLVLSAVVLVYSRKTLDKKEQLYAKHYGQLRERYDKLLSKEEADKIFEDGDPNKLGTHSNYIKWQKNRYTCIWALTLVAFFVFLIGAWCYNLYETTNICKIIKCFFACCTKNI